MQASLEPAEGATTEDTKMLEPAPTTPAPTGSGGKATYTGAKTSPAPTGSGGPQGPVSASDGTPKAEEAKTTGPGAAADGTPRGEEDPATAAVAAAVGTSKAEQASGLLPCRLGAEWAELLGLEPAPGLPQASPVTEAPGLPQAPAAAEAVAAVKPGGIESFRFAGKQGWVAKWGV